MIASELLAPVIIILLLFFINAVVLFFILRVRRKQADFPQDMELAERDFLKP